jgi:hypothetical protein
VLDIVGHFGHPALMSWPHAAYLIVVAAVCLFAVATAWRSADNVILENRVWTRVWRISLTFLAAGPAGWLVPFGAIYVIARYGRVWSAHLRTTA